LSSSEPSRHAWSFVVDEYGVVQGLLTPYDVLEAITGELQPDVHTQAWAIELPDGSWTLDGLMPVGELKARLDIDELPQEERGRYNTVDRVSGDVPSCFGKSCHRTRHMPRRRHQ
jgi:CBS domain containing-hemolysin-like protein